MKEQKPIYLTDLGEFLVIVFALSGALASGDQPIIAVHKAISSLRELQKIVKRKIRTRCE